MMIMYLSFLNILHNTSAFAGTAVIPLLHGQGIEDNLLLNISRLVADEVRFHDKYSEVFLLNAEDSKIDPDCLRSTTCVYAHAKKKGSGTAIAGKVFVTDDKLEFYLVLCDKGYFKRNVRFQLDNNITAIATEISPYIEELVLGTPNKSAPVKKEEQTQEKTSSSSSAPIFLHEDEQVDIKIDDSETEKLMSGAGDLGWGIDDVPEKPLTAEEQKQEQTQKRLAADQQDQLRQKNEALNKTKQEQERQERERQEKERLERERKIKEERERIDREKREREEKERLEKERLEGERQQKERLEKERLEKERLEKERLEKERLEGERQQKAEQERKEKEAATKKEEERAAALLASMRKEEDSLLPIVKEPPKKITSDFDLDAPVKKKEKTVSSPKIKSKPKKKDSGSFSDIKVRVTGRVGVSKFQTLPPFITYGGEISYFPIPNFDIIVGAEAYATRRLISSEQLTNGESNRQWNTVLPINIGGLYHVDMEAIIPYIGADLVMLPGYVRDANSMAMGLRLRTGVDFPIVTNVHFNINISAGFWYGEDFKLVQSDLQSFGGIPQFSGGISFLF